MEIYRFSSCCDLTRIPRTMIVDCHTHYIEAHRADRPYVSAPIMDAITPDGLLDVVRQAGVDRVVQVTASTMGWDNRYAFEGAMLRPDGVAGVFGRLDPLAPNVGDRLRAFWSQPQALGIRQTMFGPGTERWLHERALDPFLIEAAAQGVPVALFAPFQAEQVLATVDRHPGVRFLVDHTLIRHEPGQTLQRAYRHWPTLIRLAGRPNVWTKVSHFPEAAWGEEAYPFPTAQRRMRELYEAVGADRLLWGSNYPPVQRACSYAQAIGFMREACDFLPGVDRDAILGDNFMREFGTRAIPRQEETDHASNP